ncbi:probable WRKY transcription factor 58 [Humulus lupulus]|uniref:probable WRKY transcription factor 58 n=1 Tax=Humulus lupulus TaxID=3486 RepID=UPI002B411B81|nr:probable WRKY transcription factor 58 [Humulus lupulus]
MACNQSLDLSRKPTYGDVSERNQFEYYTSIRERILEDGYLWRKYAVYNNGENRRLYFKCTHPKCKVKKKVDNSHDGQITDIIYKGDHNHAEPQLGEDPEAKRRKNLNSTSSLSSRSVGEPKIVIQIKTDEDILDDGYRWYKYSQNVTKGNQNLRRYYKCTSGGLGCKVKKRVERDSGNLIIKYEGRHNHEVPEPDSASVPTANNPQQYSQETDVEEDEAVFLGGGYYWREYGESYYKCSHPNRSCGLELSDPLSSAHGLGSSAFSLGEVPQELQMNFLILYQVSMENPLN